MTLAKTTDRGYGAQHRNKRKALEPIVARGEAWCWRCGKWIPPGTPWDVGHDDHDRTIYRGPEHTRCNRRAGALRARRNQKRRRKPPIDYTVRWLSKRGRACEVCGVKYDANWQGQRTCSRACGRELQRRNRSPKPKRMPEQRTCTECGQPITSPYRRLTCTTDCGTERNRRRNREYHQQHDCAQHRNAA